MKKRILSILHYVLLALPVGTVVAGFSSCSDNYMENLNTDKTKASKLDPNSQLTTALLQTYGDFGLMDTYRSYITGFTQHFAGGWNVSNYAGSVHADNEQMSRLWSQYYSVAIKNLVDAIEASAESPNLNAALRVHKVYLMSVLTDTYGDIPCKEAGLGFISGVSTPKYDTQEEIYNYFFTELDACVRQLGTGTDRITGDVTSMSGDVNRWKKYANSLRLRYAIRISDVAPDKAREEFEKALAADGGYITTSTDDAYINYIDGPFTLYDGSREFDFRVNALGEVLYGQDPTSPTFICSTFFELLESTSDPRLYRISRHYINTKRSEISPDREENHDVTEEVLAYLQRTGEPNHPCNPGAAWWNNWITAPANAEIPTLERLVRENPEAGYDQSNFPARMMRPALSIEFEMPDCPGVLMTSAEVEYLLAEAKSKGWDVAGDVESHFVAGVKASMQLLNEHYLSNGLKISNDEINQYVTGLIADGSLMANARKVINTQAWILHMTNPSEAWANLRRSDYPVLKDRKKLDKFPSDFTYDDTNLSTPTRLKYPNLESKYNSKNYQEALQRLGGSDDWHKRLWWDSQEGNFE